MIERQLQQKIESRMFAGKAIIVIGARQVGKSTLFRMILEKQNCKTLQLNCDEPEVKDMLTNTQFPSSFLNAYDVKQTAVITPDNWMEWVV